LGNNGKGTGEERVLGIQKRKRVAKVVEEMKNN